MKLACTAAAVVRLLAVDEGKRTLGAILHRFFTVFHCVLLYLHLFSRFHVSFSRAGELRQMTVEAAAAGGFIVQWDGAILFTLFIRLISLVFHRFFH